MIRRPSAHLVGERFERLTVERLADGVRKGRYLVWLCRCACGGTREVTTGDWTAKRAESCGCLRLERQQAALAERRAADVTDPRAQLALRRGPHVVYATRDLSKDPPFGRLTAVALAPPRRGRKVSWVCRCACGNPAPVIVRADTLLGGRTQSCGCLLREARAADRAARRARAPAAPAPPKPPPAPKWVPAKAHPWRAFRRPAPVPSQ